MDSTFVSQIGQVATQLGIQAKTVLVWWLLLRFGQTLVIASVFFVAIWRGLDVIRQYGRGARILDTIVSATSQDGNRSPYRHRLEENDILKAQAILVRHWNAEKP